LYSLDTVIEYTWALLITILIISGFICIVGLISLIFGGSSKLIDIIGVTANVAIAFANVGLLVIAFISARKWRTNLSEKEIKNTFSSYSTLYSTTTLLINEVYNSYILKEGNRTEGIKDSQKKIKEFITIMKYEREVFRTNLKLIGLLHKTDYNDELMKSAFFEQLTFKVEQELPRYFEDEINQSITYVYISGIIKIMTAWDDNGRKENIFDYIPKSYKPVKDKVPYLQELSIFEFNLHMESLFKKLLQ